MFSGYLCSLILVHEANSHRIYIRTVFNVPAVYLLYLAHIPCFASLGLCSDDSRCMVDLSIITSPNKATRKPPLPCRRRRTRRVKGTRCCFPLCCTLCCMLTSDALFSDGLMEIAVKRMEGESSKVRVPADVRKQVALPPCTHLIARLLFLNCAKPSRPQLYVAFFPLRSLPCSPLFLSRARAATRSASSTKAASSAMTSSCRTMVRPPLPPAPRSPVHRHPARPRRSRCACRAAASRRARGAYSRAAPAAYRSARRAERTALPAGPFRARQRRSNDDERCWQPDAGGDPAAATGCPSAAAATSTAAAAGRRRRPPGARPAGAPVASGSEPPAHLCTHMRQCTALFADARLACSCTTYPTSRRRCSTWAALSTLRSRWRALSSSRSRSTFVRSLAPLLP